MTYEASESGIQTGAPYELYAFTQGSSGWRYTTAEAAVNYNAHDYTPAVVEREPILQNNEDQTNSVTVAVPRDLDLVEQFIGLGTAGPVALTIYRNHRGLSGSETATIFIGQVVGVEFQGSQCLVHATSLESAFAQPIGRVHVQRTCPWMLYDGQCGQAIGDFTEAGTVTATASQGLVLTVSGVSHIGAGDPDPTYYVNGIVVFGSQRRMVVAQDEDDLTLFAPFNPSPTAGAPISCIAGCDRTPATCVARFDNIARFGGFPFMPQRNVWDRMV